MPNTDLLIKSNAIQYHQKGYTGKNEINVILDGNHNHMHNVSESNRVFAPDAHNVLFNFTSSENKRIALDYIHRNHKLIDFVNISLGSYMSLQARDFLEIEQYDIPIICASGNGGNQNRIIYPAAYNWTIAIGAYSNSMGRVLPTSDGGEKLDAVSFSMITIKNSVGREIRFSDTSAASPVAMGLLNCYNQWRKENGLGKLKREECRKFIHDNCIDKYEEGFDYRSGHGLFILPDLSKLSVSQLPKESEEEAVEVVKNNTDGWIIAYGGKFIKALAHEGHTYVPVREFANLTNMRFTVDSQNKIVNFDQLK